MSSNNNNDGTDSENGWVPRRISIMALQCGLLVPLGPLRPPSRSRPSISFESTPPDVSKGLPQMLTASFGHVCLPQAAMTKTMIRLEHTPARSLTSSSARADSPIPWSLDLASDLSTLTSVFASFMSFSCHTRQTKLPFRSHLALDVHARGGSSSSVLTRIPAATLAGSSSHSMKTLGSLKRGKS